MHTLGGDTWRLPRDMGLPWLPFRIDDSGGAWSRFTVRSDALVGIGLRS